MTINFQIKALPKSQFDDVIQFDDNKLAALYAKWIVVDEQPGFPCRVSLTDAAVGERVLALPYFHHDVNSPYRACGPIFVREYSTQTTLAVNEVPTMLRHRLQSIRAYNSANMMIAAQVLEGGELELGIKTLFENEAVEYIHVHNANPGCFNCAVYRA